MKHPVLALLLLAALGGGVALWWTLDEGDGDASPIDAELAAAAATDPGEAPPSAAPEALAADVEGAAAPRREAEAGAGGGTTHTSVAGRIELNDACADMTGLEALVFARAMGVDGVATAAHKDEGVLARAAVLADGSFRVPVQSDSAELHVALYGPLHYSPSVEARAGAEDVVLRARPGAVIEGRVTFPDDDPGEENIEELDLRLSLDAAKANPMAIAKLDAISIPFHPQADGSFRFLGVPTGINYVLDVLPEHFAAQRVSLKNIEPCEQRRVDVVLNHGGGVRGVVVDGSGAPVPGAEVGAYLVGAWFGFDDREVREATADAKGEFELLAVTPGTINLKARAEGFLESRKVAVEVERGAVVLADPLTVENGKSIAGHVTWPDGRPAQGANVRVEFDRAFMAGPSAMNALRGSSGSASSKADGSFHVDGLGAGPFTVRASINPEAGDDPSTTMEARTDAVQPGTLGMQLVLHPPMGVHGRVLDDEGAPIPSFKVHASRMSEGAMGSFSLESTKSNFEDEEGRFLLTGVSDGTWKIFAQVEGFVHPQPVELELPCPTEDDPVILTLVRAATIRGSVRGPGGEGVAGASVLTDDGQPAWTKQLSSGPPAPEAESLEGGAYELTGLPPGAIAVYADGDDYARGAPQTVDLVAGQVLEGIDLTLSLGGTLLGEVYGNDGELAEGQFVVCNNLKTMANHMAVSDENGEFVIEHMDPGMWQVIAMNRGADFSNAQEGGNMAGMLESMKMSQADIIEGQTTEVQLGAPPADPVTVHGRVTHAKQPYEGALVSFYPEGGKLYERMRFAPVDEDGRYEIVLDGPGTYVVNVQRTGSMAGQQQTIEFSREIPKSDDHRLDLEIPLGRISGSVRGPSGEPASGARITLSPAGGFRSDALLGGQYSEIVTDAEGRYDLEGLRPGRYTLAAGGAPFFSLGESNAAHGRVLKAALDLDEDEWMQNVDFHLEPPGSLTVRVTSGGSPASGAHVFVRDASGAILEPFSLATTDATGKRTQSGLAPGDYTVTSRLAGAVSAESSQVTVRAGDESQVNLALEEGTILWIRLTHEGEPVKAKVRVTDSEGREWGGMFGMDDLQSLYMEGGFSPTEHRLGPLPAGRYRVEAENAEGKSTSKPVTLSGGERKLTLRLK